MIQICKEHGITIVPVDLDLTNMQPSVEDIKRSISPKTVACVFIYNIGVTYDIAPFVEILSAANIEIIEDAAQSWRSLEKFRGSDFACMTMFSYGLIKHNTAFYGAVTIIRHNNECHRKPNDKPLSQKIEEIQNTYKLYSLDEYSSKIRTSNFIYYLI
jgi:dTDP-4-amino-4,6-dideoxygalactose transaminase